MTYKFLRGTPSGIECPVCGNELVVIELKNTHQLLGCPGYPTCKHTEKIPQEWYDAIEKEQVENEDDDAKYTLDD